MKAPPPTPKKVPPFRIEVRRAENPAAWWIIEMAHTPDQRDAMLKRRQLEYGETHARGVPNGSLLDAEILLAYLGDVVIKPYVDAVAFIVENKQEKKFSDDKGLIILDLPRPEEIAAAVLSIVRGSLPPGYPPEVPVSVPAADAAKVAGLPVAESSNSGPVVVIAAAPAVPLPFQAGDFLEDIYAPEKSFVRVTKIHSADGSGRAFDWENVNPDAPEKTGMCPIASIECFRLVDKKTQNRLAKQPED